jgi:polysaccharide export outer membrane protein
MKPCSSKFLALCLVFALPSLAPAQAVKPVLSAAPPQPSASQSQSAGSSQAQPSGTVVVDPTTYVIGPDDNIQVNVWNEPKVSGSLPVRPDGMISLPLIGDMPAAGRTPMVLATEITKRLEKLINDPDVTVSVLGVNSKHVYMVGNIGKVGPLNMTPGMTILQAIVTAGGPSDYANKKHIYILRQENGKELKIPFDYKKAVKTGDMQGITLLPGDTIVVP